MLGFVDFVDIASNSLTLTITIIKGETYEVYEENETL